MDKQTLTALCNRAETLSLRLSDPVKKERCLNMIKTLLENETWPDLKIGGWLEHVVTVCIENGVTTIDKEREFSRPIKHAYYKSIGADIPKTTDVMSNDSEELTLSFLCKGTHSWWINNKTKEIIAGNIDIEGNGIMPVETYWSIDFDRLDEAKDDLIQCFVNLKGTEIPIRLDFYELNWLKSISRLDARTIESCVSLFKA